MINFADKEEMELKCKVLLSEVTQTRKPNFTCILMYVTLSFKSLDFCVYLRVALEARKLERGHWGGGEKDLT